jgi:predicted phosphodiesterase
MAFMPILLFAQTSIYDIQYTTVAGDGTYPSLLSWQTVTTGGIVTATDYLTGQYFISSSKGGPWEGLFVYDNTYSPSIGDSILITGTVAEYQGYTELKDLTSFEIKSTSNTLPETAKITTVNVTNEAYEGVLVELNNSNVSTVFDELENWRVDDGSGDCEISTGFFKLKDYGFPLIENYLFSQIIGVIGINSGNKKLHPRSINDIQSGDNALIVSTNDKGVDNNSSLELPVKIAILNQLETISTYSLKMEYDPAVFEYTGFNKTGTISESGTITDVSTEGSIELNYTGSFTSENIATLVNLIFTPISYGNADLQFNGTTINGSSVTYFSAGDLEYSSSECDIPIGDTLTIVQRPLLNIPSIVVPGQELNIVCFAPESTTDWEAELFFEDIIVPLDLTQSSYDSGLARWTLTTSVPEVDLYELYDLRVTASGGISDDVTNAVKIIDQFKTNYYFVHITDLHLLGHTFYGESGYETDESEMEDFQEVINDINLIRPEFVLLTGDLINEGELEDFECLRNHTRTLELLAKFEVPVYIVPGNHDLGGWDATPPPQGTAHREWWRFFGWRQRVIPPVQVEYYTHDYSFDYGNVHFTGFEAYDNYDSYMYAVFGSTSFTSSQISWLQNNLANAGDKTKVLFYHYDFKHELNLSALGVDMALWGHTHSDSEDAVHPYDISTVSVCDGNRAFRVVRVNNGSLQAENSIRTHSDGDMLSINYNLTNDGSLDSVSATVNNKFAQSFSNGLIKFKMPISDYGYSVTNGVLEQVLISGSIATCYVRVNILNENEITVSIKKNLGETPVTKIYDIQFTTIAGSDGTYPSTLNGQTVTTGGTVTATGYIDGRYFISSSQGGAWNGLFIYDNTNLPTIGDSILITGKVTEYYGFTEMIDLTSFEVISAYNPLPETAKISTVEITSEAYEGVFVEVNNCNVSSAFDEDGNWATDDGSGTCYIRPGIYDLINEDFPLILTYPFSYIKGVIGYHYGFTSLHPRLIEDIQSSENAFIIITDDQSIESKSDTVLPIKISILNSSETINTYSLKIQYDPLVFQYLGYDKTGTISESGTITDNSSEGNIELNYSGSTSCNIIDQLVKLNFRPLATGSARLQFNGTEINESDLSYSIIGSFEYTDNTTSVEDVMYTKFSQNFPNPFSTKTKINYILSKQANVNVSVYNLSGQLVKVLVNELKTPGEYSIIWDATNPVGSKVENGIYIYKYMIEGKQIGSQQMIYIK